MSDLGRLPTPTAVMEARGAFKKHPERRRPNEPLTGRGIGPPPEFFTDAERNIWDATIARCAPGVFQSSDHDALMIYSLLLAEMLPAEFTGKSWKRIKTRANLGNVKAETLLKLWARFGMTPSDRTRIEVVPNATAGEGANKVELKGLAKFMTKRDARD